MPLKRFDAGGDRNPALRTLHPDEVTRSQPTCVIESARFKNEHVLYVLRNLIDADSAFWTEYARILVAAVGNSHKLLRQASYCQAVFLHQHGHAEGAAGLALACNRSRFDKLIRRQFNVPVYFGERDLRLDLRHCQHRIAGDNADGPGLIAFQIDRRGDRVLLQKHVAPD